MDDSSNDISLELAKAKALTINEMALVNKIIKTTSIKMCTDFSEQFVKQLLSDIEPYDFPYSHKTRAHNIPSKVR